MSELSSILVTAGTRSSFSLSSRSSENIATEDPYNEAHGIKVETRYQTGNPNGYQLTSNPFRAATATVAANEPSMGRTRSNSWNTGRKQEIETFSGAALPAPCERLEGGAAA